MNLRIQHKVLHQLQWYVLLNSTNTVHNAWVLHFGFLQNGMQLSLVLFEQEYSPNDASEPAFETSLQKYVYYTPANTMIAPGSYMLNTSSMAANQTQPLATYYTYAGSVAKPTSYVVHGATNGASNGITNPAYIFDQTSLAFVNWNQNWGQKLDSVSSTPVLCYCQPSKPEGSEDSIKCRVNN